MSTMGDGESYLGRVLIRPLSKSGEITLFLWPLRCLNNKTGGPTFGIDVNGEEALRFDVHGSRGHWHQGYDKQGIGGSQQHFPEELVDTDSQLSWALAHVIEKGKELLSAAGYPGEAPTIDQDLVKAATEAVKTHLETEGDVRAKGIQLGVIEA